MGSRLPSLTKAKKEKSELERFLDPGFLLDFFMSHKYTIEIVEIIEKLEIVAPSFSDYAKGIIQDEALTATKIVKKR